MASILHFSEASSLALHAIIMMAGKEGELVTSRDIAASLQASEAHLQKVLQRLVKVGILASTRGPRGGFRVNRPLDSVKLLDVYEAVEGPLPVTGCLFSHPKCDGSRCIFGTFVTDVTTRIREYLSTTTLLEHQKDEAFPAGGAEGTLKRERRAKAPGPARK